MAKINIVLADSDELYLNRLTNYFIEKTSTFDVCSFTSKVSLLKYISDGGHKTDVLAFSEDLMDEAISAADIPAKILLSDGTFSRLTVADTVHKYQKAEKIVNDILLIYAEKSGRLEAVSSGDKKTKVIGVYSPVGGAGKTTVALALAQCAAQAGRTNDIQRSCG
jgi:hypothetical protein